MKEDRLKKMQSMIWALASEFLFMEAKEIEDEFWLINVTWVKLASDLSYLDIFVSSFKNQENLCKALSKYDYEIVKKINERVQLRKSPRIRFRYDEKWEISRNITSLINTLEIPND